jgi:hypothetical protein
MKTTIMQDRRAWWRGYVITYSATVDETGVEAIAQKAAGNKKHIAHDGPLTVHVTSIRPPEGGAA